MVRIILTAFLAGSAITGTASIAAGIVEIVKNSRNPVPKFTNRVEKRLSELKQWAPHRTL